MVEKASSTWEYLTQLLVHLRTHPTVDDALLLEACGVGVLFSRFDLYPPVTLCNTLTQMAAASRDTRVHQAVMELLSKLPAWGWNSRTREAVSALSSVISDDLQSQLSAASDLRMPENVLLRKLDPSITVNTVFRFFQERHCNVRRRVGHSQGNMTDADMW